MNEEDLYNSLNRMNELDDKVQLTPEERREYETLTKKRLFTLEEIRNYHDHAHSIFSRKLTGAMERLTNNWENQEDLEFEEGFPKEMEEKLIVLINKMEEKSCSYPLEDVMDDTTDLEFLVKLREGILFSVIPYGLALGIRP